MIGLCRHRRCWLSQVRNFRHADLGEEPGHVPLTALEAISSVVDKDAVQDDVVRVNN